MQQSQEAGVFPRAEFGLNVHPLNASFDDGCSDISDFLILSELLPKYKKKPKKFDGHSTTTSRRSTASSVIRKRLSIVEPDASSVVFFDANDYSRAPPLPPEAISGRSLPRSILKKHPSANIYEEIGDDEGDLEEHVSDVRPELPARPVVTSLRLFPPCTLFQPRSMPNTDTEKYPEPLRRKKLPSLHRKRSKLIDF
ncbi:unnamed protein product, partial [Mesorhabditis spiculigera]